MATRLCLTVALLPARALGLSAFRLPTERGEGDGSDFSLTFYKDLENPYNSVFTSCSTIDDRLQCFQRVNENGTLVRMLDRAFYSADFKLLRIDRKYTEGEDPRVLNSSIVFDNFLNDMKMIDLRTRRRYPVLYMGTKAKGKNYVWFVHQSNLYAISRLDPLTIIKCRKIFTPLGFGEAVNCMPFFEGDGMLFGDRFAGQYRGGTVGYTHARDNLIFGFAHRTHDVKGKLKHEVFQWKLLGMSTGKPHLDVTVLELPGQKNICDPTSVVVANQRVYLLTAESHYTWFRDQTYHNKVYELRDKSEAETSFGAVFNQWNLASVPVHEGIWDLARTNDDDQSEPVSVDLFKGLNTVS